MRALPPGNLSRDPLADAPIAPDLAVFSAHVDPFGAKSKAYPQDAFGASAMSRSAFAGRVPDRTRRTSAPAGGGITYTENGVTATQNGSAIAVHGTADLGDRHGYKGTLELSGNIPLDKQGKPLDSAATLEFGVEMSKGNTKAGFHFRLGMTDGLKFDAPCPTASGDVNAKEKLGIGVTSHSDHADGLDYVRSHTTLTDNSTWHGTVDTDAKLERIDFTDSMVIDYGRGAAAGPIQVVQSSLTTVAAAGSIDGSSGQLSLTSFTVDGHASASGIGSSAFESNFATSLRSESSVAEWKKLMTEAVHFKWERFKAAETEWRKENACAKIVFDPESDHSLPPGAKRQISGRVLSKAGDPSDSKWAPARFDVGSLGVRSAGSDERGHADQVHRRGRWSVRHHDRPLHRACHLARGRGDRSVGGGRRRLEGRPERHRQRAAGSRCHRHQQSVGAGRGQSPDRRRSHGLPRHRAYLVQHAEHHPRRRPLHRLHPQRADHRVDGREHRPLRRRHPDRGPAVHS